jgi:hypothetical protein
MSWPTLLDYRDAIQNPRLAFSDPDLRTGQPELTKLGLPNPRTGSFASVYKIEIGTKCWAARCFSSEVSDQQRRYEAISTYLKLKKLDLPYMVDFIFLPGGIKVLGKNYPLLKMEWVQGESLSTFVGRSIGYPDTLKSLANFWKVMMGDLKAANMAHGDLQHENVVVVGDQLRLVDYDGMYVPGLAGNQSNECGHRNYQLPSRTGYDFGPYLDNFSAWVIYVSLLALAVHPELWINYQGGDNCLIFRKEDFEKPENSALLRDLNSSPNTQLRILVELFTSLFNLSPQDVPSLDGNLPQITVEPPRPWWIDHAENQSPARKATESLAVVCHNGCANANQSPENHAENPKCPSCGAKTMLVSMDSVDSPQRKWTKRIRVEEKRTKEAETSNPDPSWILDSLMEEKPVEPLKFQSQAKENRIVIFGSMALVALTRFLVEIPVSELLVIVTGVFGLNLLMCFIRYKYDPSHAEFESFKKQSQIFLNQVREHHAALDALLAERLTVQTKLTENERAIAAQKSRLATTLQTDLNSAQLELNSRLQGIAQRRRDISTSETNKLSSLQGTLGNQVSEFDRKISGLTQKEADEKSYANNTLQTELLRIENTLVNRIYQLNQKIAGLKQKESDEKNSALSALQNSHIQNYLRSYSIVSSWIPGIGEAYKTRLYHGRFLTALDIDGRVRNVSGIGATKETALMLWRQGLEQEARMSAPNLSPHDRLAIESKYRQTRQTDESEKQRLQTELNKATENAQFLSSQKILAIENQYRQARQMYASEKQRLQTQLNEFIANARQHFADVRQSINQEEQQLRTVCSQKKVAVQQEYDAKAVTLDKAVVAARNQAAPILSELSQKLQSAQKQIFALKWQTAKSEKEGRRFASLRFKNYLHSIISS